MSVNIIDCLESAITISSSSFKNRSLIHSTNKDNLFYRIKDYGDTYEVPLGITGNIRYTHVPAIPYTLGSWYDETPKTGITFFMRLRNSVKRTAACIFNQSGDRNSPVEYIYVGGMILTPDLIPIIEITLRRNKENDRLKAVVIRVNTSNSVPESVLTKYIKGSLYKNIIGKRLSGIPIKLAFFEYDNSPIYKVSVPEDVSTESIFSSVEHVIAEKAEDIANIVLDPYNL